MNKLNVVILAAGKGTRMLSTQPKVLHKLAGKFLLQHVLDAVKLLTPEKVIVVYGYGGDDVKNAIHDESVTWVEQSEQLGTGHAVLQTLPELSNDATTLILLGDVPLISPQACKDLLSRTNQIGLLTIKKTNPVGYGRVVRDVHQKILAIVEHKDASEAQKNIDEVNTGIFAVKNKNLIRWVQNLSSNNAQKEYYLTDIIAMAVEDGLSVASLAVEDATTVEGVNSKQDLANLEREFQVRVAKRLMENGVQLADPNRVDVRGKLVVGKEVEIDVGCIFEGQVEIADQVKIGPYCVLKNCKIGKGTEIAAFTHIEESEVGVNNRLGPYARLRPGTVLGQETHIGNFVELKNTQVDTGSKVNHLSYVGDTTIGKHVNIGAGTITCNYDGANKFRTVIKDNAFIGSDTQLVAPVTIGKGATIAAGSTITKDAPEDALTLCRAREQKTVFGWKRPEKIKKADV